MEPFRLKGYKLLFSSGKRPKRFRAETHRSAFAQARLMLGIKGGRFTNKRFWAAGGKNLLYAGRQIFPRKPH